MAHIVEASDREIIRVPLAALELPSNLPAVPLVVQEGSFSSTPCNDDTSLMATLLRLDRRSLFTGSIVDLEVAYLIPPNEDPSENARVEEVCNRLGLGGNDRSFRIDGLLNTFLLETSLRTHLDGLATFCITLPFVEFCSLCGQLGLDNQEWSERAKQDPTAQRILGNHEPRLHTYEVQQLAFYRLSPAFLPNDAAIQILPSECRTLDQPCPNPPPVPQRPAIYAELICQFPSPPSLRSPKDGLSPLALLVNAHYKFQTYMAREPKRRRCFHLEQYSLFLNRFMDLLYFVPPSGPEVPSDTLVADSTGLSLADASDRNRSFERDNTSADALEMPDEDDLINGLTIQEMDSAIRQASDPRSTDAARVQAAMLMFGMAGNHRLPDNPLLGYWGGGEV
ncbi:hypothetical protein EV714DRAFT_280970 [Schizophyllum commune]